MLQIEDGVKNKTTKLIEGIPNADRMEDGETEEFFDADEEFDGQEEDDDNEANDAPLSDAREKSIAAPKKLIIREAPNETETKTETVDGSTPIGSNETNDNDDDSSSSEIYGDANEEFE